MGKYYDRNGGISTPADKQFAVVVVLVLCLLISYPREIFLLVIGVYLVCFVALVIAGIWHTATKMDGDG